MICGGGQKSLSARDEAAVVVGVAWLVDVVRERVEGRRDGYTTLRGRKERRLYNFQREEGEYNTWNILNILNTREGIYPEAFFLFFFLFCLCTFYREVKYIEL